MRTFQVTILCTCVWWADACVVWLHIFTVMRLAVHGEAAKHEKKLTFYANKISRWAVAQQSNTWSIRVPRIPNWSPWWYSWHKALQFGDLLVTSKVWVRRVAMMTLRSDQQGDTDKLTDGRKWLNYGTSGHIPHPGHLLFAHVVKFFFCEAHHLLAVDISCTSQL